MKQVPGVSRRQLVVLGAALTATGAVVLALPVGLGWLHGLALSFLCVFLPVVAVVQLPPAGSIELVKSEAYASSAVTLVVLGGASFGLVRAGGGPGSPFTAVASVPLTLWVVGLVVVAMLVTLVFKWVSERLSLEEEPLLRAVIPRTSGEKWAFVGLSVCAGFGEEMAYRGYVLAMLAPLLGPTGGVVASSLVFGALHAYQGLRGVLRTGLLGAMMAVAFLATGSLWPVVVAHALFDVLAGVFLADFLMVPEDPHGVSGAEAGSGGI